MADAETEGGACPVDPDAPFAGDGAAPEEPREQSGSRCCLIPCGAFLLAALLFGVSGYALDRRFSISTTHEIAAPPAKVFPIFNSARGIQSWWETFSEQMKKAGSGGAPVRALPVDGPGSGVGAQVEFQMGATVTERWEIVESVPDQRVVYRVAFLSMGMTTERKLTLSAEGQGTRVTWTETGEVENPVLRWVSQLSEDGQIKNFDLALDSAAKIAEAPEPTESNR
jgi:uncharacterized protein YndB with AHSA1/START domain